MTDKPAATVHGTGSGEPTCPHENAHVGSKLPNGGWEHICNHCHAVIGDSISGRYAEVLTPPASQPAVTLDRATFDKLCNELEMEASAAEISFNYPAAARLNKLLVIIRAAVRK